MFKNTMMPTCRESTGVFTIALAPNPINMDFSSLCVGVLGGGGGGVHCKQQILIE